MKDDSFFQKFLLAILCIFCFITLSCKQAQKESGLQYSSGFKLEADGHVIARVECGQLRGVLEGDIAVFRGIPYAAPPVGDLRWRPPQSHPPWDGIRDATDFGKPCPQPPPPWSGNPPFCEEDCLTLNIWAPSKTESTHCPVMVWIHGGAFILGSSSHPYFEGISYAKRGVVLVSINYRLGRFGFFSHPALAAEYKDEPRGNYGILDMIAALKWIKKNIAFFGGNPDNVTIFGESAGGTAVNFLMVSPLARGLFHRAISQSGSYAVNKMRFLDKDREGVGPSMDSQGEAFSAKKGISENVAATLRSLPAEKLMVSTANLNISQGIPVIDGMIIPDDVLSVFARGEQAPVPLMIGGTSYEAYTLAFGQDKVTPLNLAQMTGLSNDFSMFGTLSEEAEAIYVEEFGDDRERIRGELFTDVWSSGSRFLANKMAEVNAPAYLYRYAFMPSAIEGILPGTPHGIDSPYTFLTLHTLPIEITENDQRVAEELVDYLIAFARTGEPNGEGRPYWPSYLVDSDELLEFTNQGPKVRAKFIADRMAIHDARLQALLDKK